MVVESEGKIVPWRLIITRVDNGYVLEGNDESRSVIQENERDELSEHIQLLWQVQEYFGFGGSKHDKERIQVIRKIQK